MRVNIGRWFPAGLCVFLLGSAWLQGEGELVIDAAMHHLGNDSTPEWSEAPAEPEGTSLELEFESGANAGEWVLAFTQRNVDDRWTVAINGVLVAVCLRESELVEQLHPVPAGTIVEGANRLVLTTEQPGDDITFGRVRLIRESLRELLDLRAVEVTVDDGETGAPIAARITIRGADGAVPTLHYAEELHQAVRDGVVYTDRGVARFEVAAGEYELYASRGPEWGLARAPLVLEGDAPTRVALAIRREVDTGSAVSCDTHIHTLTFSGHGDSSVEERMVTLAGEDLDVAISTDHNHNTDYRPYQQRMGLEQQFLTVVGNEVTTSIGPFNAFPLDPDEAVPPHESRDVRELVDGMRQRGAQAVILNHPRWPSAEDGPFGEIELNHFTGAGNGTIFETYPFDAMELVNSCTDERDPLLLFRDWFSLLNRGERVVAVGSSDSHTVGEPVGGGRTYVHGARGEGTGPESVDVAALCAGIREGRSSISMGIYANAFAAPNGFDSAAKLGSCIGQLLAPGADASVTARVGLQAPSWVRPRKAVLFGNGDELATIELETRPGEPTHVDREVALTDEHGGQDAWYVWVVLGDGIETPHWPLANDYTLAATNPFYVDWDGDGSYTNPRATAASLLEQHGLEALALRQRLATSWPAVRHHALDLVRVRFLLEARDRLRAFGAQAGEPEAELALFMEALGDWDELGGE